MRIVHHPRGEAPASPEQVERKVQERAEEEKLTP
jgi:hypothetical protein